VRFDDKLDTVFAQPADDSRAVAAVWMQIVDILAQDHGGLSGERRQDALAKLARWRNKVPLNRRMASARSLVSRQVAPDLISFFGDDVPQVAAPILTTVQLNSTDWLAIIPGLAPASRALLRERRDLPEPAVGLLGGYGLGDFALPGSEAPAAELATAIQIRDLVARIEAFRRDHGGRAPGAAMPDAASAAAPVAFRFETTLDGLINWVDGAPRGPIIGIDTGTMAEAGEHGVDGHAAGAFRRRTPYRNARLVVPGAGPAAGDWVISGLPRFDEESGRFLGYRGTARRAQRDETPVTAMSGVFGAGFPADSLRQLVHELRTPLNAIRGFAEMISGQILGPVSRNYRSRASDIIAEAQKLLTLFDDLDVAAKLDRGVTDIRTASDTSVADVLQSIATEFLVLTNARHVHLRLNTAANLPHVSVDSVSVERMLARLLGTVIGLAKPNETISAELASANGGVAFTIDRPQCLSGLPERALLDPAYGPEGEWPDAPALGLGFALRLIGNMAKAAGGSFVIGGKDFLLRLPARTGSSGDASESK
jgi:His Kinase A (phospho-acceptor) domain